MGTVLGLVMSGLVLASTSGGPAPAAPPFAATPGNNPSRTTPGAGDTAITVTTVSSVDLLEGVYTADSRPIAVRVAGIRPVAPCWSAEATARAADLLRDKQVWLIGQGPADPDGRVRAGVLLPDGRDYALAILGAGAARLNADHNTAPQLDQLAATEAEARESRRGSWSSPCGTVPSSHSVEQQPNSQDAVPSNQTPPSAQPPHPTTPIPPTTPPTTTTPPPHDEIQHGVRLGTECSPEGARGLTDQGQNAVCAEKTGGPARWRKA